GSRTNTWRDDVDWLALLTAAALLASATEPGADRRRAQAAGPGVSEARSPRSGRALDGPPVSTGGHMFETLEITREGALTWLTLTRRDALNAMNGTLIRELRQFFWELPQDRATQVVVLRGSGRAFCAGLDLKATAAEGRARTGAGGVAAGLRSQREISEIMM